MHCPQCGNEHLATHSPCPRCGFTQQMAEQMRPVIKIGPHSMVPSRFTVSLVPTSLSAPKQSKVLVPEMSLQKNRYILVEQLEMRQWSPDAYEARWLAQDMKSGEQVIICVVVLPLTHATLQQFIRSATNVLMMSSNQRQTTPLLDVFMEHGYGFFVFVHLVGESLQARVQRGEVLSEHEAMVCYLQIAEALLFLSQQRPDIVHGSIQPDHIVNADSRWVLTNGSVLSAGRAAHYISSVNSERDAVTDGLTPISDLHALARVMYYAVTGTVPSSESQVQQAHLAKARLSPPFTAILLKGIHPHPQQRYQHPFDIVQALGGSLDQKPGKSHQERRSTAQIDRQTKQSPQPLTPSLQSTPYTMIQPPIARGRDQSEQREGNVSILLRPEDLPPMPRAFDTSHAIAWTTGILLCGIIFLLIAR